MTDDESPPRLRRRRGKWKLPYFVPFGWPWLFEPTDEDEPADDEPADDDPTPSEPGERDDATHPDDRTDERP